MTERKSKLSPRIAKAFSGESPRANQLVVHRPDFWEYLLTAELLSSRLAQVNLSLSNHAELRSTKSQYVTYDGLSDLISSLGEKITIVATQTAQICNEDLPDAWGPDGQDGNPLKILDAVDKLSSLCKMLLEARLDVRSRDIPEPLWPVIEHLDLMVRAALKEYMSVLEQIVASLSDAENGPRSLNVTITFKGAAAHINEATKFLARTGLSAMETMKYVMGASTPQELVTESSPANWPLSPRQRAATHAKMSGKSTRQRSTTLGQGSAVGSSAEHIVYVMLCKYGATEIASILDRVLPTLSPLWWEQLVLPSLRKPTPTVSILADLDMAALLNVFDTNWRSISGHMQLPRHTLTHLKELKEIRRKYMHLPANGAPVQDSYRALDTLSRFLTDIGASEEAIGKVQSERDALWGAF